MHFCLMWHCMWIASKSTLYSLKNCCNFMLYVEYTKVLKYVSSKKWRIRVINQWSILCSKWNSSKLQNRPFSQFASYKNKKNNYPSCWWFRILNITCFALNFQNCPMFYLGTKCQKVTLKGFHVILYKYTIEHNLKATILESDSNEVDGYKNLLYSL